MIEALTTGELIADPVERTTWTAKDGSERSGWRLTAAEILSVHQARKRRETEPRDDDQADDTRQTGRMPPQGDPRWLDA